MAEEDKGILGDSPLGRLFDGSDDSNMALMQIGLQMMGPQQQGTGFGQNILQSVGGGLNYLSQLERARNEASLEQQGADTRSMLAASQANQIDASVEQEERNLEQGDMQNAIRLYGEKTGRLKAQAAWHAAKKAASKETDEIKKAMLEGILDIYNTKAGIEEEGFDTQEFMSIWNLVQSGLKPDRPIYDPSTDSYYMTSKGLDSGSTPTEEAGPQYHLVTPSQMDAVMGRGTATGVRKSTLEQKQQQDARSVPDVSTVEAEKNPDGSFKVGTDETADVSASPREIPEPTETGSTARDQAITDREERKAQEKLDKKERNEAETRVKKAFSVKPGRRYLVESQTKAQDFLNNDTFKSFSSLEKQVWLDTYGHLLTAEQRADLKKQLGN